MERLLKFIILSTLPLLQGSEVVCPSTDCTVTPLQVYTSPTSTDQMFYGSNLTITIKQPPNTYILLKFRFHELVNTTVGMRVFDVLVNDSPVLFNLDVLNRVPLNTDLFRGITIYVPDDGNVVINLKSHVGSKTAIVSGIFTEPLALPALVAYFTCHQSTPINKSTCEGMRAITYVDRGKKIGPLYVSPLPTLDSRWIKDVSF